MIRFLTILGLLASGCGTGSNTPLVVNDGGKDSDVYLRDGGLLDSSDPFFVLFSLVRATPIPRTIQELVATANVVGIGQLVSVTEGRTIDFATGASNPTNTGVFAIGIEDAVKGSSGMVYAEFIRGGIPVDRMMNLLPTGIPMMFMLEDPADHWSPETYKFINEGNGLPSGAQLHEVVWPTGIIIETAHGLEYPLADDPAAPIFQSTTLTDLREELAAALTQ